jgi:hypothetical protein
MIYEDEGFTDDDEIEKSFKTKSGHVNILKNNLTDQHNEYDYEDLQNAIRRKSQIKFSDNRKSERDAEEVLKFLHRRGMDFNSTTTIREMIDFVNNLP